MGVCCTPPQLECHENETRMPENETRMHSKTKKTIFEYEKNETRMHSKTKKKFECVFGFWFIDFGPNVMDVGHTPCGISVHPVSISAGPALISGGPTSMWYGPDSIGLSIGQQSLSDGPSFKSSTCDLFVSVWSNGLVYYPGCRHAIRIGLHCDSPATPSSLSVFR